MAKRRSQAVVLIHGIGEQRPMSTVRGFCEAVLPPVDEGPRFFSKPNQLSESFELRTLQNRQQPRTRFFEYYWAHHAEGTTVSHVIQWLTGLLLRRPSTVPSNTRGLCWLTWLLIVVALAAFAFGALGPNGEPETRAAWRLGVVASLLLGLVQGTVIRYVGDAARYLSPSPENITLRQAIRRDGVELLRKLHDETKSSGEPVYERIVLVGHSLGSVIAYDILKAYWQQVHRTYLEPKRSSQWALEELEYEANRIADDPKADGERYQRLQSALHDELLDLGHPWRVTDLVTIASPLAHAALLLARDEKDLVQRQAERELPTCPPVLDEKKRKNEDPGFSFQVWEPYNDAEGGKHKLRALHHAALFAVTRWTNLYAPSVALLIGDFIGGPLRPWFGFGITDRAVRPHTALRRWFPMAHISYWSAPRAKSPTQDLVEVLALDPAPPDEAEEPTPDT